MSTAVPMNKRNSRINRVLGFILSNEESTFSEIAKGIRISDTYLANLLKELIEQNIIIKKDGKYYAQIYYKDPKILKKIDYHLTIILKMLSKYTKTPNKNLKDLKYNINVLIEYLLR